MKVCYLDLDGVLVDFVGGALRFHGKTLAPSEVSWDFNDQLGLSGNAFWGPLGFDFWSTLEWTAEGKALLHGVEALFGDAVVILTKPPTTEGSVEGKVAWIKKHLPEYRKRYLIGPTKHHVAGPGKFLVDDHEGNCDEFAASGGRAVLVPRPWNRRKAETDANGRFVVANVLDSLAEATAL